MELEEKNIEAHSIYAGKEKNVSASESTYNGIIFQTEMTVSQANAIMKMLPKNYSIHVDRTIKQKRTIKRTFTVDSKSKEIREVEDSNFENHVSIKE